MRHTRNRQMILCGLDKKHAKWNYKGQKNHTITFARQEAIKGKEIDPTFKWSRN
ncbi:hypothetical protein P4V88_01595 [Bacillus thuringiensis]|uniref:hypothetical protein n=1 Tax=Bacillus TaxID=1386 RepID=UPI0012989B12|nr:MULTISPECIES: hypothetical protein [Bacillus]MCU5403313.1 hypothetical protein [Bacillus cereus]MDA2416849.1 hypothetical protein [Bacillus cereus]MEB9540192.1 hypothetical protein [Bacillus cereus]MED2123660.1 hypothetical protein [Bacillus thuringiensis]MED2146121.1 hypothetical protein [Bacillus thuringiensis]